MNMFRKNKPTPWPYRLWPISGLWAPSRFGLFRDLKAINWKWSGDMQLPLWLRIWVWFDTDVTRNYRLAYKWTPLHKYCEECGEDELPFNSEYCMQCGAELGDSIPFLKSPNDRDDEDWDEDEDDDDW